METDAKAEAVRFGGSPTFHVNGADLFDARATGALSCRIYTTAAGISGVPGVASLTTALRQRLGS
ncbi:hypothetical protein [Dactylosporangium matsuzakiense]|uniref:Uncharacterized protein n=1 Tax=Dactylosporangium matsuzakiense TaxID=53360 RepID=A0A9W6KMI0_9ACTN|nr:hypothetical protein [Dactylosporangium matsuzakiense]GLL03772.1 hypothetical protein GCM10017581_055180 [Dactylosporangium matsuzakiense]